MEIGWQTCLPTNSSVLAALPFYSSQQQLCNYLNISLHLAIFDLK
jgi:hypothetical protein